MMVYVQCSSALVSVLAATSVSSLSDTVFSGAWICGTPTVVVTVLVVCVSFQPSFHASHAICTWASFCSVRIVSVPFKCAAASFPLVSRGWCCLISFSFLAIWTFTCMETVVPAWFPVRSAVLFKNPAPAVAVIRFPLFDTEN